MTKTPIENEFGTPVSHSLHMDDAVKFYTTPIEKELDKVYDIGFKNGRIDMKNEILKAVNRDWKLVTIKRPIDLIMKILKKINSLK